MNDNKRVVYDHNRKQAWLRVYKREAKERFENGERIFVMTDERNPATSLTSPHLYKKGMRPYKLDKENLESFVDLLQDYAYWLDEDGYGHVPQHYKARKQLFSYWVKI